ncbi:MAG: SWIM zinc finger domain-containing protein [Nanoarchaeota archaeon]|nr:SWIM zinc finger domain-containing protein [Nanoarchaeota archaeon]
MQIENQDNIYKVQGTKDTYDVNLEEKTCTCPHFLHRMQAIHQYCKHIHAVIDKEQQRDEETYDKIKQHLKENPKTTLEQLEAKFNPEAIDDLISKKEITLPTASSTTQ